MFNEAETLKWVNAYREEFGLPLLDQLPAGQKRAGGSACMMGRATPGISYGMMDSAIIVPGSMIGGDDVTLPLPTFVREAERTFERYEMPADFYHADEEITNAAYAEADSIRKRMTPKVIERLQAKFSQEAWEERVEA